MELDRRRASRFYVDGVHKRTLAAPCLFGELSVIYGTERTAEARVVESAAGAPVLWTLDKRSWEEFMAMDIRHRATTAAPPSDRDAPDSSPVAHRCVRAPCGDSTDSLESPRG